MIDAMGRPDRNGECKTCGGKIRHYPHVSVAARQWAHMDRADWIDNPHDPDPTDASLAAAGLT